MKLEPLKVYKSEFGTKQSPARVLIPERRYLELPGAGDPNSQDFADDIAALYAVAYTTKMTYKKSEAAQSAEFDDYTVFPLEGYWDITAEAQSSGS
jgi:hypothetical protein